GDSTPDMEKLIAISDLFEISLDELVKDKAPVSAGEKAKRGLKLAAIVLGVMILIDVISMIVYFGLYGFPR
ncbi:MAG: hypothetical protein ACI4SA_07570, partial [Lachnospiraceae bacterium]